jgi:hypothetical protein
MALSPSVEWVEAVIRDGARIRFLIDIYDGTTHWKALFGSCDQFTYPEAVHAVAPVGVELDPLTREVQTSEVFVDVDDGWIRPILVNNVLKGQQMSVKIGAAELAENKFVDFFTGPIEEIHPIDGHTVKLSVLDVFEVLQNSYITGYWMNKHPLEILYAGDGSGILERAGVNSNLIDTTSFDPSDSEYTGSISHFIISRGGNALMRWSMVETPTSAFQLASEVAGLMNGHFITKEAGQISFNRFDAAASALDDWGVDDILPGSFRQEPLGTNVINRIVMDFAKNNEGRPMKSYRVDDPTSQSDHAYLGATNRIMSHKISTEWLNTRAALKNDITDADGSLTVYSGACHGFSGNKNGSPAWSTVSGTREVYLLLDSSHVPDVWNAEIVRSTVLTKGPLEMALNVYDPSTGSFVREPTTGGYAYDLAYGNLTRGMFNTNASAHKQSLTYVFDITIVINLVEELLSRFKDGCSIIEMETNLGKYEYQIGDFVTITHPGYMAYGKDGLSGSDKWEIVTKEVDIFSDPPKIRWRLAAAGVASPVTTGIPFHGFMPADSTSRLELGLENEDLVVPHIISGLVVSQVSGLDGKVSAGVVSIYPDRVELFEDVTYTFTASKDTYVTFDIRDAAINFKAVGNGAAAPVITNYEAWLAKVVTDGTTITDIDTSGRQTKAIDGGSLFDETITYEELADNAVTTAKINGLAVTEAKIAASAVTEGKIGSSAVTESKIGTNAVIEAKINAGAVTEAKLGAGSVTEAKIGSLAVTSAKIGAAAVSEAKIDSSAVTAAKIASSAVTTAKVATNAIGPKRIAADVAYSGAINPNAMFSVFGDG